MAEADDRLTNTIKDQIDSNLITGYKYTIFHDLTLYKQFCLDYWKHIIYTCGIYHYTKQNKNDSFFYYLPALFKPLNKNE